MADHIKFKYPQLPEEYRTVDQLFGSITHNLYSGVCRSAADEVASVKEVAIRAVNLEELEDDQIASLRAEVQAMKSMNHPNLVKFRTSFTVDTSLWIVMQLAHHGSVRGILDRLYPCGFEEEIATYIMYHTVNALAYLHGQDVVHRDIKGAHILLDKKGHVLVSGFSVSTFLLESGERKAPTTLVGSLPWMGPEVLVHGKDRKYSTAVDIWSLGITALELATGCSPFEAFADQPLRLIKMVREDPPGIPADRNYSKAYHSFLSDCLQQDPAARPLASKLLEHKLFRRIQKKNPEDFLAKLLAPLNNNLEDAKSAFERPRSSSIMSFRGLVQKQAPLSVRMMEKLKKGSSSHLGKIVVPRSDSMAKLNPVEDEEVPEEEQPLAYVPEREEVLEPDAGGCNVPVNAAAIEQAKSAEAPPAGEAGEIRAPTVEEIEERKRKEKEVEEEKRREEEERNDKREESPGLDARARLERLDSECEEPSCTDVDDMGHCTRGKRHRSRGRSAGGTSRSRSGSRDETEDEDEDETKKSGKSEKNEKSEKSETREGDRKARSRERKGHAGDCPRGSSPDASDGSASPECTRSGEACPSRSVAVPIETHFGESSSEFVIMVRTISGTTLSFKVKGCEFIISGELPALPTPDGVVLTNTPVRKFEKKISLPEEIRAEAVRREKVKGTIIIRIGKSSIDLGKETM